MPKSNPRGRRGRSKKLRSKEEVASDDGNNIDDDSRNPMQNPVVLAHLFEVCSLSDLPRFRLVSKQWHSLTLTRFRNSTTVIIQPKRGSVLSNGDEIVAPDFGGGLQWDTATLDRKLDVGEKPFRTFRLCHMEFDSLSERENGIRPVKTAAMRKRYRNMRMLFTKYGPSIRKLVLWQPHVCLVDGFTKGIFEQLPNLEELTLMFIEAKTQLDFDEGEVTAQPNLNMKSLVVHGLYAFTQLGNVVVQMSNLFPNLQKVEVGMTPFDEHCIETDTLLEALTLMSGQLIKKNGKLILSPMRLWLHPELYPAGLQDITMVLELPQLTILNLKINTDMCSSMGDTLRNLVPAVFRRHGHTLTKLKLNVRICIDGEIPPHEDFPFCPGIFNSLRGLKLGGEYWTNLHFLGQFPNLETLKFLNCGKKILEDTTSRGMRRIRLNNLRKFSFSSGCDSYVIPDKTMKILVDVMPNVEEFGGDIFESALPIISSKWKKFKNNFC